MRARKIEVLREDDEDKDEESDKRFAKAKRHEIVEPADAIADLKLAEKLDTLLKISGPTNKPKFLTNRARNSSRSKSKEETSNIKLLSTTESVELGKQQAKKQIERQLQINSVSGNQAAHKTGLKSFKFNDGYELSSTAVNRDIKFKKTLDDGEITLVLTKKTPQDTQDNSKKRVQFLDNDESK